MLRTGQLPAPSQRRSSSASTPGSHPTPGVLLPGTLASPRAGLTPAGCRELVARLRRGLLLSVVLGARATGRTLRRNTAQHHPTLDDWHDPPTASPMLHPRCIAVLRMIRVERRWSGEASSVMTSAWNADWCEGLGARPRDVRVAEVVED